MAPAPRQLLLRCLAAGLLGCGALAGCDERPPVVAAPPASASQALDEAPEVLVAEPTPPARLETWALRHLSVEAREAARLAPVPLLVPPQPRLLAGMVVSAGEHFVAFHTAADGLTWTLHGTRLAYRYPELSPVEGPDSIRGTRGFLGQEEGTWSATWLEGGVAYSLDLECAVASDPRCADASTVAALAESLVAVSRGAGR